MIQLQIRYLDEDQLNYVNNLYKPIKYKFPTSRVLVNGINNQWQTDLEDMRTFRESRKHHTDKGLKLINKNTKDLPKVQRSKFQVNDQICITEKRGYLMNGYRPLLRNRFLQFLRYQIQFPLIIEYRSTMEKDFEPEKLKLENRNQWFIFYAPSRNQSFLPLPPCIYR